MSKSPPARYRTTDWSGYNASLRKRGSLLIRIDEDMTWRAPHDGRPGRPPVSSDAAMQFRLSIKVECGVDPTRPVCRQPNEGRRRAARYRPA